MARDTLIDLATQRLHSQGGRMTGQRRMILEALDCLGCHPTAEQIYAVVNQRDATINLSTVYRTLRWLEQEGLVSARRFDEKSRQDRFDPALPVEHHHFVCTACGMVIEFDDPRLRQVRAQFERQNGAQVASISVMLQGLCAGCKQTKKV
jgi:Fur family transcriptional regulator, ferric uptake regulator